ncbi:MAG: hypothetical protein IPM45_11675 [Acidimicrobiales bacterium]|nr:hypothetical protein [Acidimicrobiales bacterium]
MALPRLLTIMGSGETAPTMVKVHRGVLDRLGPDPVPALVLDTPFGFQENADDLSARAVDYFRDSVGRDLGVAGLRRTEGADTVVVEAALARVRAARFVFAGPGSPSYALRQWAGTPLPGLLADKLAHGGAVTFASAAALTLGLRTVPVYEIYKVGADPFWLDGLDLLTAIELPVAVIPHYDNAEGGHHDTRFCYLGETRLAVMETMLPAGAFVLGVDEHTGVVLDLDEDTATVVGLGRLTLRRQGRSVEIPSGETVPIDLLRRAGEGRSARVAGEAAGPPEVGGRGADVAPVEAAVPPASLAGEARRLEEAFEAALAARDATAAVAAVLDLEQAIVDWSRDTLQSDEADRARAALRAMVVRLGEAARSGLRDPREVLAPVVGAALALRAAVRAERRYDLSDLLRDGLAEAGIEVRDTAAGVEWVLAGER